MKSWEQEYKEAALLLQVTQAWLTSRWPAIVAICRAVRPPYPTCCMSAPLWSREVINSALSCKETHLYVTFLLIAGLNAMWQGVLIPWLSGSLGVQKKPNSDFLHKSTWDSREQLSDGWNVGTNDRAVQLQSILHHLTMKDRKDIYLWWGSCKLNSILHVGHSNKCPFSGNCTIKLTAVDYFMVVQ